MRFVRRGPACPRHLLLVIAVLTAGGYAWWSTDVRPFTVSAYVAVGIPVGLLALAVAGAPRPLRPAGRPPAAARPRPQHLRPRTVLPWVALLVLATGLECAGLALGGRSATVPTLSTVADHALVWHGVRFVLFLTWLALGWTPVVRARRAVRPHGAQR